MIHAIPILHRATCLHVEYGPGGLVLFRAARPYTPDTIWMVLAEITGDVLRKLGKEAADPIIDDDPNQLVLSM